MWFHQTSLFVFFVLSSPSPTSFHPHPQLNCHRKRRIITKRSSSSTAIHPVRVSSNIFLPLFLFFPSSFLPLSTYTRTCLLIFLFQLTFPCVPALNNWHLLVKLWSLKQLFIPVVECFALSLSLSTSSYSSLFLIFLSQVNLTLVRA